jgi:hypothetical protein
MNRNPDSLQRFAAAFGLIACVVTLILLGAAGCGDWEGYAALAILAAMCAAVATSQVA